MRGFVLILYALLALFNNTLLYAQAKASFVILGSINADTGTAVLLPLADTAYYADKEEHTAYLSHGKFLLKGSVAQPALYKIGLRLNDQWAYISGDFFVASGIQHIVCDTSRTGCMPDTDNEINKQLKEYRALFSGIRSAIDSITLLRRAVKKDNSQRPAMIRQYKTAEDSIWNTGYSILHQYAHNHNRSAVVLWSLIARTTNGYHPIVDSVFNAMHPSLRRSYAGKVLAKKIDALKRVSAGQKFPLVMLPDTLMVQQSIANRITGSRYVFIDFWFSGCAPCIKQFQELKSIYATTTRDKVTFIGISVDKEKDIKAWKQTISKYGLPWTQFIDINGVFARQLSISSFPTNFLLDANGYIIGRDITIADLTEQINR